MSRKRKQLATFPTLLLAVLLSVGLHSPAHAAVDVTSNADTSWRFSGTSETFNFADGLDFTFSDDKLGGAIISRFNPGVSTAMPPQTFNALGTLHISMTNPSSAYAIGARVERRPSAGDPAHLYVEGGNVYFTGSYTGTDSPSVCGLSLKGSGQYDSAKPIGAYAKFENDNTYLSAFFEPPASLGASVVSALNLDHDGGAVFNGNAFLDVTNGANSTSGASVVSSFASHTEFNGKNAELKGTSASTTPSRSFYGIYDQGNYEGGIARSREAGFILNSSKSSINVTSSGANDVYGIYMQLSTSSVTDKVKNFVVSAKAEGTTYADRISVGIQSWNHAILDIQAENTIVTTNNETANSGNFSNYGLYAWTNGRINLGGKNAIITTNGVSNGGVALYANGRASLLTLADGFKGNTTTDITVNADNINITSSSTTGAGQKIAAYAYNNGLIYINSNATGADQGKTVNVTGDVYGSYNGETTLNLGNGNSLFTGHSNYFPGEDAKGIVNIGLTNNARWYVTRDSYVTNFTAGDGHAYLGTDASHFATLTRDPADFTPVMLYMENLKGTNGNFYLRADIDGEKADTLYIINGAGNHNLFVRSQGAEPSSEAMSQYLAHQETGSAQFGLGNPGGLVDAGLYVYELAQRNVTPDNPTPVAGEATEWYLKRATRPVPPTPEPTPTPTPTPIAPVAPEAKPIPSPTGEAEMALSGLAGHYAMWYGEQTDLRKRLGEIRYGTQTGLWVRGFADKARLDGFNGGRFTQETYGGSIGYDKIVAEDETWMWFLGMQLRGARANQKVKGYWGGTGDLDSLGAGLYSTWAHADGWYVDAVATYDHYNHKIRTTMLDGIPVSDDRSAYGLGASLEAGRKILFGFSEDQRDYWFVEPQLQLSYFWVKGGDFTASNGMTIDQRNMDSLNGRAGFVLGKKFELGEKKERGSQPYVQPYVKAGVNHEFLGDQVVHINDTRMESDLDGTRVYYGAGVDWQVNDNLRLYTQAEREHGSHFTREFNVSAGFKWEF